MAEKKEFGDILTLRETAEYLQMSIPTIYLYVRKGKLPAKKMGNRWRFSKEALQRFLDEFPQKKVKAEIPGDTPPPG